MRIDSINMKEKEFMIKQIRSKNIASILDLDINWIEWLSSLASGKEKTLLVIECQTVK